MSASRDTERTFVNYTTQDGKTICALHIAFEDTPDTRIVVEAAAAGAVGAVAELWWWEVLARGASLCGSV